MHDLLRNESNLQSDTYCTIVTSAKQHSIPFIKESESEGSSRTNQDEILKVREFLKNSKKVTIQILKEKPTKSTAKK